MRSQATLGQEYQNTAALPAMRSEVFITLEDTQLQDLTITLFSAFLTPLITLCGPHPVIGFEIF